MKPSPVRSKWPRLLLALALTSSAVACKVTPRPPVFSLYGFQRLAMAPFDNPTADYQLSTDLQAELTQQILRLGACPVLESAQVAALLAKSGSDGNALAANPDLQKQVGSRLKCDILMTGATDTYQEYQEMGAPRRNILNSKTGEAQWGFSINRRVTVAVSAKLYDPSTGSVFWTQRATGNAYASKWNVLPIPGDVTAPPSYVLQNAVKLVMREVNRTFNDDGTRGTRLRYMDSSEYADLRRQAIANAVWYLTGDFKGHGGWTPNGAVK